MTSFIEAQRGNKWFAVLGVIMVLTGIGAFAFPLVASLSVEVLLGCAFLVGGIATLVQSFREKEWKGIVWLLAIGVVYLMGGLVFLINPFAGVIALTVLLGAVFLVEGTARIVMGFQMRSQPRWGLLVASGAMSVLLAILVFSGFTTGASLGFIGVMLGINFVFAGASLIALGSAKPGPVKEQVA